MRKRKTKTSTSTDYEAMTYRQLQTEAKIRGLRASGKKEHLLARLQKPAEESTPSAKRTSSSLMSYFSTLSTVSMNGMLAWILQEAPVVVCCTYGFVFGGRPSLSLPNRLILGFLLLHYSNRTFVFPLLIRGGKPTPVWVFLAAFFYCCWNGFMQTSWLAFVHIYPDDWIYDPRFIFGGLLAFLGMCINMHSDHILRNLRKPGETGYKIPRGGCFEWVSGANFLGEIMEWTGFAVAQWSLPGLAFALFTMSNIGPRGVQHHQNYIEKFDEYEKLGRKAIIPYLL